MRNIITTAILAMMSMGVFAQTTLTYQNNALLMGESCTYNEIQFVEPGNTGPNQIWDYSKIEFNGKNPVTSFQPSIFPKIEGIGNYNLMLEDDGYNYFMNSSENALEELGYVNKEKDINLVYSDPVLKMKYTFYYGDNYTDPFTAVAFFNKDYKIEFTGEITTTADAYGTLLMPDRILKNVLRVKSVKEGVQVNRCGQVKIEIVKYSWYAEGNRYPVLIISIVEKTYPNSLTSEITKTASVYSQHLNNISKNIVPGNSIPTITNINKSNVSVTLFPNPFSEKITYTYFLKNEMPVTIALYDVTGKFSEQVVDNQTQAEGFHSGEIGGLKSTLPAGVYYLRFIFGEQVQVSKFVKLEAQ